MRAVKAAYAPFPRFPMDVKYLTDLPLDWPQRQSRRPPRFPYTIREFSWGAQLLADSQELSRTDATFAVERLLQHLRRHGIDTTQVQITTDLGAECDGDTVHYQPEGFPLTIEQRDGAKQRFNPPSCPNANADVESVHATIETEFFEAPAFTSRADFWAKITTYPLWDNVARKNGSRRDHRPLDLLARDNHEAPAQQISPEIVLLHPIPLASLLPHPGGHDVPGVRTRSGKQADARHCKDRLENWPGATAICHAQSVRDRTRVHHRLRSEPARRNPPLCSPAHPRRHDAGLVDQVRGAFPRRGDALPGPHD